MLAYDSKCKNFIKNYEEGKDVYLSLAAIHSPEKSKEELKAVRGTFKRLNLNKPGLSIINAINCWELPTEISGQSAAKLTL